jgi:hypothetical protein
MRALQKNFNQPKSGGPANPAHPMFWIAMSATSQPKGWIMLGRICKSNEIPVKEAGQIR